MCPNGSTARPCAGHRLVAAPPPWLGPLPAACRWLLAGYVCCTGLALGARDASGAPPYVIAYYRFEEGSSGAPAAGPIVDAVDGSPDGIPSDAPVYRADVPSAVVPQTGEANRLSLEFSGAESVLFDAPFGYHAGQGDTTLEFFIKAPEQSHHSLFWTRGDDSDINRYNLAVNSGGGIGLDYRDPSGNLHMHAGSATIVVPPGKWTHVAVVRDTQSAAPAHVYRFYLDGGLSGVVNDPEPDLPTSPQWSLSGRSGFRFVGSVDEVRLCNRALSPAEFLISAGVSRCGPDISFSHWPAAVLPVGLIVEPAGAGPGGIEVGFVMDESGSISGQEFLQQKDLIDQLARSLRFGPFGRAGLVAFSTDARVLLSLTDVKTLFINTLHAVVGRGGETCLGCGILAASDDLLDNGSPQRFKLIVLVTDGLNNRPEGSADQHLADAVTLAASRGHITYAIGVGSGELDEQITRMATSLNGARTAFLTPEFAGLRNLVQGILVSWAPFTSTSVNVVMPDGSSRQVSGGALPLGEFRTPAWKIQPGPNVFSAWIETPCGRRSASLTLMGARVPGDFDRDADVDLADLADLQACASGPAVARAETPLCEEADFDHDNDVDQADFGVFQACYSGAGQPGDLACAGPVAGP